MNTEIILKIVGVGILVAVATQILGKSGRDDQSMLVGIAGIVVVLLMLAPEISDLFDVVLDSFGL